MRSYLPAELRELASLQDGVLTAEQVLRGGLSKSTLRSRLDCGRWQRMRTGVYAMFSGEPGRPAVLWAAVLRAGPGALLSHHTAAELHMLTDRPAGLMHVTIPDGRRIARIEGVVLHRSARTDRARHPTLLPARTRVEETVLDLVDSAATMDDAYGWVTRALGRRLTTQARLADAAAQRGRLRWRGDLAPMLESDQAGVHSSLEVRYLRDVEEPHALPHGLRQALVRRGRRSEYRDVLYEQYGVAVELDGRAAHPGDLRWRDIHRDNAAAADGVITLRYGWLEVTQQPCLVAAQVSRVLAFRGYAGGRACSPGCAIAVAA